MTLRTDIRLGAMANGGDAGDVLREEGGTDSRNGKESVRRDDRKFTQVVHAFYSSSIFGVENRGRKEKGGGLHLQSGHQDRGQLADQPEGHAREDRARGHHLDGELILARYHTAGN